MPFPTDPFEQLHYNMVRGQSSTLINTSNSSLIQNLDNPKATGEDLSNFLGYCQAWVSAVSNHHDSEETIVFPFLNQKMDFAPEKEAHEVIHKGLDDFEADLVEAQADPAKLDSSKMKQKLEQMKGTLFSHLDEEVEHIKSEELKNAGFCDAELKDLNDRLDKYAKSHGDPFVLLPFMRSHTPPEFKEHWPPMPWVLRKLVVPYVLAWRYSRYWKYAPYSVS